MFRRNHAARRNSERKDESRLACPCPLATPKSHWILKASWHGERPAGSPKLTQHGERPAGLGSLLGMPLALPLRGSLGSQRSLRRRKAGWNGLAGLNMAHLASSEGTMQQEGTQEERVELLSLPLVSCHTQEPLDSQRSLRRREAGWIGLR